MSDLEAMPVSTPVGVCSPWATIGDLCSPCDDYEMDTLLLENSLQWASDILFDLTHRRWPGVCTETVLPCSGVSSWSWGPEGQSWCGCGNWQVCGCHGFSQLILPHGPVVELEASIDGNLLSAARWRVDDGVKLVYLPDPDELEQPGRNAWPCCQDLTAPLGAEGTFSITYSWGSAPPIGGTMAAASLGCQLAMGCQPETLAKCRLPKRVTSITRQGVAVAAVLDPLELFAQGLTGLPEVDLWVASANRGAAYRGALIYQPGQRSRQSFRRPGP